MIISLWDWYFRGALFWTKLSYKSPITYLQGTVTLVKFSSGNKPPVKGLLDKPMMLKDLIKEFRRQGVDIFPQCDSHCYIEGLPLKDIQTERHLYNCIALTANSLNFTWSRWNLLSGYDKLIMQVPYFLY